jgi:hypothetical protein
MERAGELHEFQRRAGSFNELNRAEARYGCYVTVQRTPRNRIVCWSKQRAAVFPEALFDHRIATRSSKDRVRPDGAFLEWGAGDLRSASLPLAGIEASETN